MASFLTLNLLLIFHLLSFLSNEIVLPFLSAIKTFVILDVSATEKVSLLLIVDLFSDKGIDYMFQAVSETAEYGGQTRADRLIDDDVAIEIKEILHDIQSGDFHREWVAETEKGLPTLKEYRKPSPNSLCSIPLYLFIVEDVVDWN